MRRRKIKHLVESKKKGGQRRKDDQRLGQSSVLNKCSSAEPKPTSVGKEPALHISRLKNGEMEGPENLRDLTEVQPVLRKTELEMPVS